MQSVDTLIEGRWVIPVEPEGVVLEHHTVVIDGGCIKAILPHARARSSYTAERIVERREHVLLPGLVNAHTHAGMTLMRGLADDLPLMQWLEEHIWPVEGRWVSDEFVRDGTMLAVAEMLRGGTTCFNDMYFYPADAGRAAAGAGMRCVVGMIVLDFPTVWASGADEYLARASEVHDEFRSHPLVDTAFAPHAPYTVSDGPLERLRTLADELDVPIHIHLHETPGEVESAVSTRGVRPFARLDGLGLVSPRLMAVHMTELDEAEIARLAECGTHVVHCPESNLKLASGFCPVAKLLEAGVNVALGTDGAASNNDLDMIQEMRTASLVAKAVARDATAVPAHRAISMATIAGARALGKDDAIGSLLPGKSADVIAVDLGAIESQPVYDAASQVAFSASRRQVSDVWVAGRALLRDGALLTVDEDQVLDRARHWRRRIAGESP
ncbi:MAG: TRZ/ATZ family hydrolase [Gammaproteobacteria bacterium]|nr:TRZ/ATZ family hydrolase [Gammaproteobacteria bacterium]